MSDDPQQATAPRLTRGLLSRRAGCNIETIRYYESIGLMPMPPRSQGGHRLYDQEHLKRLTFIRRARELGFRLREIRGLLALVDGGGLFLWPGRGAHARAPRRSAKQDRRLAKARADTGRHRIAVRRRPGTRLPGHRRAVSRLALARVVVSQAQVV